MTEPVVVTRFYTVSATLPDTGASFASVTILAALGQQDWQLSDDVADACLVLLDECCRSCDTGCKVTVTVVVDGAGATVRASTDAGWAQDVFVRPRRHIDSVPRLLALDTTRSHSVSGSVTGDIREASGNR